MTTTFSTLWERRLYAVIALLQGTPAKQVVERFGICRSDLYKFRRRALQALREALSDQPRGAKRPHNRLAPEQEQVVAVRCQRHPTWSARQIQQYYGDTDHSIRTIQRVRRRFDLPRLCKRMPPRRAVRKLSQATKQRAQQFIQEKSHLGPERLAWDLQNGEHIQISPSTMKRLKRAHRETLCPPEPPPIWQYYERHHLHSLWRGDFIEKLKLAGCTETAYQLALMDDYSRGYLFCDLFIQPDQRTTIHAMIAAMRQWQVIPKAIVFDNGSAFKGRFVASFCQHLGIRLIHTALYHPQTNGKLERAHRDDRRDFYGQYDILDFDTLRRDLPDYVRYRNEVRGHKALKGQPTITRLREQHYMAVPWILEKLESYAFCEVGKKKIEPGGSMRLFKRDVYLDASLSGTEVVLYERLEGLEAWQDSRCIGLLPDYRTYRRLRYWEWDTDIPQELRFKPIADWESRRPRMAVAQ